MLHVLPNAKIPVGKLPLDVFISNTISYLRKKEKQADSAMATTGTKYAHMKTTAREQLEKDATSQGLFLVPEFQWEHCIMQLTENVLSEDGLVYAYSKCAGFLRLKQRPDVGITVLLSPKWMFVTPMTQPYTFNAGKPVYLDGYAFAGLVNLQVTEKVWPATADLVDDTHTVLGALNKSTFITPLNEIEENPLTD